MFAFDERLAVKYGLEEAVMLQSFIFWIRKNAANGDNYFEGHWWTYNSHVALGRLFPFWTQKQLRRIIASLVRQGGIVKGDFNPNRFDRTCWYRLGDDEEKSRLNGKAGEAHPVISEPPERTALNCPNGHLYIGTVTNQLLTRYYGAGTGAPACAEEPRTSPTPEKEEGLFPGDGGDGGDRPTPPKKMGGGKSGRRAFVPPTIDEVRAYIETRGADIDPAAFWAFYENREWRLNDGRRMKDWRLAVVTWEKRRNGNGR